MLLTRIAAVSAFALATASCASVVDGTQQTVTVVTPPADGALCTLTNSKGSWTVYTPGNVTVERANEDMKVSCAHDGYPTSTIAVGASLDQVSEGTVYGGAGIGVGVDAATGAAFGYPHVITVQMGAMPKPLLITSAPDNAPSSPPAEVAAQPAPPADSNPAPASDTKPAPTDKQDNRTIWDRVTGWF